MMLRNRLVVPWVPTCLMTRGNRWEIVVLIAIPNVSLSVFAVFSTIELLTVATGCPDKLVFMTGGWLLDGLGLLPAVVVGLVARLRFILA